MKVIGDAKQEDIDAILRAQGVAVEAGDLDAYIDHLTEDAVIMPPGHRPVRGRHAIREWMGEMLRDFEVKVKVSTEGLIFSGNWAIDRHNFEQLIMPRGGGEQTRVEGKAIAIYRKAVEGDWKAYVDCWNSDSL